MSFLARLSLTLLLVVLPATPVAACPFCAAESKTLAEEIADSSVTLLAKLAEPAAIADKLAGSDVPPSFVDPDTGTARFSVETVLKGEDVLRGAEEVEAIYFGEPNADRLYFVRGVGDLPDWAIPFPLSDIAAEYVPKILTLPESGGERLVFFQQYLEHEDPLLAQDAYDEFARAPYADVIELGPQMDREQLLAWIADSSVSPSRRRLFLTMLGVCGRAEDAGQLERMLRSDARVLGPATEAAAAAALAGGFGPGAAMLPEAARLGERQRKLGLDALIACYLTLIGKHGDAATGLDLIDERFLRDPKADYSHIYAALQALRFLVEEQAELVPTDRVLVSARLLLDNPDFADQVIPDLARWEDWSVLERLAEMYQATFDPEAKDAPLKYVREPIITYLDVAAEAAPDVATRAKSALAVVEPIDKDVVKRARSLRAFGLLAAARAPRGGDAAGAPAVDSDVVATSVEDSADSKIGALPDVAPPATPTAASTTPPSRWLLIGGPLAAAALFAGIYWLVLRSGGY